MELPKSLLQRAGGLNPISADEFNRLRVEAGNEKRGHLPGYDCPECLNRGFLFAIGDNGGIVTRECRCMAQRKNAERIERSGLKDAILRYTFDSWQAKEPWQANAKEIAEKYERDRKGWFVICGRAGSGKTHLCTAICARLMDEGMSVRYMLWRDVSVQAKAAVNDEDAYKAIVEPLKRVKVLYIDDLFKTGKGQEPTTGDVNLAFELLNSRYNDSGKLTIISTERSMDELLDIDEAVGSRIYERSKGYWLDFSGKQNWRLRA